MTAAPSDPAPPMPLAPPAEPPEWAFIRAEVEAMRRSGAVRFFLTFDSSGEPTVSEVRPSRRRQLTYQPTSPKISSTS